MTQNETKKMDKRIRSINDPFGRGFPSVKRIILEMAYRKEVNEMSIWRELLDWKSNEMWLK